MSSISVGELKAILDTCPDDYEVIMGITEYDENAENHKKESIAYINGVNPNNGFREVVLMN